MRMVAPFEATGWRKKLVATGFPNAANFDDTTVMNVLFSKSAGRKKLLKWLVQKLMQVPPGSSEVSRDEDISKVIFSYIHMEEDDVPRFIDGFLNRDEQSKIWKSIFFELNMKRMCTEESKQAREIFLLKDVSKVALTPEMYASLGYSEHPEDLQNEGTPEEDYRSRAAKALKAAENVLMKELPVANENPPPVSLPTPEELIKNLESMKANVDLSEDPRLKRVDTEQLAESKEKLKIMATLVQSPSRQPSTS